MSFAPINPCPRCTRVPYPEKCDDKRCPVWRRWFTSCWEQTRTAPRRQMDRVEMVPLGVPLGGRFYAPPHRVREYLKQNPCDDCVIKPLCKETCKVRKEWLRQGGAQ